MKLAKKCLSYSIPTERILWKRSLSTSSCSCQTEPKTSNISSGLSENLYKKIQTNGPLNIAQYMRYVLTQPSQGYYMNRHIFGRSGDFVTSPDISQLFGELIAVWIVNEWKKIYNKPIQLVELGPGRGSLSNRILQVFKTFGVHRDVSLHLVEVSPSLQVVQKKLLCPSGDDSTQKGAHYDEGITTDNVKVFWYESIHEIPDGFSVVIANEFFDVLPIHKFQKLSNEWHEVLVDIDSLNKDVPRFKYILSKTPECKLLVKSEDPRTHVEISPEALSIIRYLTNFICKNGGFSLIIDYGHMGEKGDTFRAFRQHNQCDPLSRPGTADLTADVDFSTIKKIAEENNKLLFFGPVSQREFLQRLGVDVRLGALCEKASEKQQKVLRSGCEKLIGEKDMGLVFKAISLFPYVLKDFLIKYPVSGFN